VQPVQSGQARGDRPVTVRPDRQPDAVAFLGRVSQQVCFQPARPEEPLVGGSESGRIDLDVPALVPGWGGQEVRPGA
jgi:hypothetical protein